jgi:parvulin-like peptidyl-prolyl isomerase
MTVRITVGSLLLVTLLSSVPQVCAQTADAKTATSAPKSTADNAKAVGEVVAKVNGDPIYKENVERNIATFVRGQKIDPAALPTIQAAALKEMINNHLLNTFLVNQKDRVTPSDVKAAVNELRESLRSQNVTFEAFLASRNLTEQALMSFLAGQLMVGKYVKGVATEEGLKKFFDDNKHLFDGTTRRVSHVLLRPEGPADENTAKTLTEKAKQLRSEIQTGQIKFEEAAAKYSAGPSRQHGGDLGYVPLTGVMAPAFTKVAYEIKPDEVSEPVATNFGVHLIKVTEVKAGTKTLDDVKQVVQQAYAQYLIEKLTEDLFNQANIEYAGNYPYFKDGTKDVVMPDQAAK